MELVIQKWCGGAAKCELVVWQNVRVKDPGACGGVGQRREDFFVLGATPNFVLSSNLCNKRELCICVRE